MHVLPGETGTKLSCMGGGPDDMDFETEIRNFLAENFFVAADPVALPATVSLTQGGTIDSMGVLELIMFIEQTWGFSIPDQDTIPENLDTIERITAYVKQRLLVPAGA